jgi:hypothetical protein
MTWLAASRDIDFMGAGFDLSLERNGAEDVIYRWILGFLPVFLAGRLHRFGYLVHRVRAGEQMTATPFRAASVPEQTTSFKITLNWRVLA